MCVCVGVCVKSLPFCQTLFYVSTWKYNHIFTSRQAPPTTPSRADASRSVQHTIYRSVTRRRLEQWKTSMCVCGSFAECKSERPARVLVRLPEYTVSLKTRDLGKARRSKGNQSHGGVRLKIILKRFGWMKAYQEEEKEKMKNKDCAHSSFFAKRVFLFFARTVFLFFLAQACPASTIFEFPA